MPCMVSIKDTTPPACAVTARLPSEEKSIELTRSAWASLYTDCCGHSDQEDQVRQLPAHAAHSASASHRAATGHAHPPQRPGRAPCGAGCRLPATGPPQPSREDWPPGHSCPLLGDSIQRQGREARSLGSAGTEGLGLWSGRVRGTRAPPSKRLPRRALLAQRRGWVMRRSPTDLAGDRGPEGRSARLRRNTPHFDSVAGEGRSASEQRLRGRGQRSVSGGDSGGSPPPRARTLAALLSSPREYIPSRRDSQSEKSPRSTRSPLPNSSVSRVARRDSNSTLL